MMTTWLKCGECGVFVADDADPCPACGMEPDPTYYTCEQCKARVERDSPSCGVCKVTFEVKKPSALGGLFGKQGIYRVTVPKSDFIRDIEALAR